MTTPRPQPVRGVGAAGVLTPAAFNDKFDARHLFRRLERLGHKVTPQDQTTEAPRAHQE
jgi:hypothetical protein